MVTWGDTFGGGDSRDVQQQLKGVTEVQGTDFAFAAIVRGGRVVTWGDAFGGGCSNGAQDL